MKHKNFFIVPNQIFELGLKPKEFVVYCCLLRHSDKNTDNCFPSRRLIADECSMDKKTVDSALKELEAEDLSRRCADTERTVLGQVICTTLHRSWNSVEFPYGWLQIFVPIRRLKRSRDYQQKRRIHRKSALPRQPNFRLSKIKQVKESGW